MEEHDSVAALQSEWHELHPEVDLSAAGVILRIIRVGRIAEERLEDDAQRHGFRVRGDYEILSMLRRREPLSPLDMADDLLVSRSGMTGRLDRLEATGLIKRNPHPTDRRSLLITLTDKGRRVADETFLSSVTEQANILRELKAGQVKALTEGLERLLTRLED